jgi:hypothetical protein
MQTTAIADLAQQGFTILREVYAAEEIRELIQQLTTVLQQAPHQEAAIRARGGVVYAARNLLQLFPAAAQLWRRAALLDLLRKVLGSECGLVRGLYFDKPPEQSWSLPWHQDLTIAVREHRTEPSPFQHPTWKAGVAHVEAPVEILQSMLTLRIHLDAANLENGALLVLPGSHGAKSEQQTDHAAATPIIVDAGDVLAMRPLLSHCSGNSAPHSQQHRRIFHLEFAAREQLPDGYHWHYFERL